METAISQPTRNISVGHWAYPGGIHGAALCKPVLPCPLYGIYTLPHVSAASFFIEAHIHTPTVAEPALTPTFLFLHSLQSDAVKSSMLERRSRKSIQNRARPCGLSKPSPLQVWGCSFHSFFPVVSFELEFSSIPGYSCTASICRCRFTASQDMHVWLLLFLRKVTSGWK